MRYRGVEFTVLEQCWQDRQCNRYTVRVGQHLYSLLYEYIWYDELKSWMDTVVGIEIHIAGS